MNGPRSATAIAIAVLLVFTAAASGSISVGGWDHLGDGGAPNTAALNGRVDALYAAAPDALYAGGAFTSAGGDPAAAHLARWDGSAWHAIGAPVLNNGVAAIAYDNGKLYVGGNFTDAGGNPAADFVAVWDGVSWQPFCAPIAANVTALKVVGRKLYIGGTFLDGAGIASADRLVACDLDTGASSSTVDSDGDIGGAVLALTADSAGRLYAAGSFIDMDQIPAADYVAMYDGTWHAMGSGAVTATTRSVTADGANVYIGSDALNVGGIAQADHVAKWNGTTWSALGANTATSDGWFPPTTSINAIVASSGSVYAAGAFQNADGHATADEVAVFNGTAWAAMGSDGAGNGPLPGPVNALAPFAGQTVVGGSFVSAGGDLHAANIARYPGLDVPPVDPGGPPSPLTFTSVVTLAPGEGARAPKPPLTLKPRFATARIVVKPGARAAKLWLDCPVAAGQKCAVKGTVKKYGKLLGTVAGSVTGQRQGEVVVTFTARGRRVMSAPGETPVTVTIRNTTAGHITTLAPQVVLAGARFGEPPSATTGAASSLVSEAVGGLGATLAGFVRPNGQATRYHFEVGYSPGYGQPVPVSPVPAGDDFSQRLVTARVVGLSDLTTYHYRLVAESAAGTTLGADRTFVLPAVPRAGAMPAAVTNAGIVLNTSYHCSANDVSGRLVYGSRVDCSLTYAYDNPVFIFPHHYPELATGSLVVVAPAGTALPSGDTYQRVDFTLGSGNAGTIPLTFIVRHPVLGTESLVLQGNGPPTIAPALGVGQPVVRMTSQCTGAKKGKLAVGALVTCQVATVNTGPDNANLTSFQLKPSRGLTALGAVAGTPPDVIKPLQGASTYSERYRVTSGTPANTPLSIRLAYTGVDETDGLPFSHAETIAVARVGR